MPWTHLASSAPAGTTKGSVDRGRSFEVRERRGPKVSFPESPFREGEGIRGGGTPLPALPGDPDAASGGCGGDPARRCRGSQVTPATPSPRRRRIPRVSSLPAPAQPPILLCPAARESLLQRRGRGQEGARPGGGWEGKAGESRRPKLPAATG